MKHYFAVLVLVALSFSLGLSALAHQPRYIKDENIVLIENPEISQAFYGELKDRPAYYLIDLKEAQDLFFQILEPALPGINKDKLVTIDYVSELGKTPENFLKIDSKDAVWKGFYEEYGGDNYLEGPTGRRSGSSGYYFIEVSSPDNTGKYVLVVGEKEEFSAKEVVKALVVIPQLKTQFFNKPAWRSFEGRIGQYSGLGLVILLIVIYLFYKFHQVYK